MKKFISFILTFTMLFSLCSCGSNQQVDQQAEPEEITLTEENIRTYLSINQEIGKTDVVDEGSFLTGKFYSGTSSVMISLVNQSGAKFKNVKIVLKVYTNAWGHEWEFLSGDKKVEQEISTFYTTHYKEVVITLPYDGNYSFQEQLKLYSLVTVGGKPGAPSVHYSIVSVTGTVIV